MTLTVRVPNLGPEFEIGTATPNKITLAVDGSTIVKDPVTGVLSVDPDQLMIATDDSIGGDGSAGSPLSVAFSADANNGASLGADGAVFANQLVSGALNGAGDTLEFTMADGSIVSVDATALTADVRLISGVYNAGTESLDLTVSDGTTPSTVSIPVAALLPVTTDATISGDGAATPLGVNFSADAGNAAIAGTDGGVFVPAVAATTNTLVNDGTNTLTSTVDGVAADADIINAVALAAGATAGTIKGTVNGVDSTDLDLGPLVRPLLDVEVTDAFGVVLYYASSTNT